MFRLLAVDFTILHSLTVSLNSCLNSSCLLISSAVTVGPFLTVMALNMIMALQFSGTCSRFVFLQVSFMNVFLLELLSSMNRIIYLEWTKNNTHIQLILENFSVIWPSYCMHLCGSSCLCFLLLLCLNTFILIDHI